MPAAAEDFLKSVLRSGLLDRDQLVSALRGVAKDRLSDPQQVAKFLIAEGKLSRFQAHKLLEGATLGLRLGPFSILTPIGKGGMGMVYLAEDTRTGKLLAIKVLPPKRARSEERYLARFQREMEFAQKVSHPHIAQTHEVGESQGVYYIAMEYIPGQSLYRLVHNEGSLIVTRAAHFFDEVAAALQHAHGVGLIHRDLKPSNIMITPNDHAKVLDLGLAMMEGEVAADVEVIGGKGYVVGTVDYMAPEQTLDASQVDARADLYALGCVLTFALTGKPPFSGGTTKEKIAAHRKEQPEPIRNRNPSIPADFADIVSRLLAKKPDDRYPSATAFREDLIRWLPKEALRPVEREGDPAQQAAARALENAPLSAENLTAQPAPVTEPAVTADPVLPSELFQKSVQSEVYIVLGLGVFWIVIVMLILGVLLAR